MKQKRVYTILVLCMLWVSATVAADFSAIVFHPSPQQEFAAHEKHIVIVTASYNNLLWYEGSLASALWQNYKNFEIILTDDCSPDGTGDLIEAYLRKHDIPCKVTLVKNNQRCGALQNIYRAISWCKDTDIIAVLDGDDRLAHPNVLAMLNEVYANPDIWMTHGRLQLASTGTTWHWQESIPKEFINNNTLRSYYTIASHLRTFYAGLFRKIKVKDLLYEGYFLPVAQDVAWAIPMMELCAHHHAYIDTVTYLYNDVTPLMDAKVNRELQLSLEQWIRAKPAYTPCGKPLLQESTMQKADVVIYPSDCTNNIEKSVRSVIEHVHGIATLFIMTTDTGGEQQAAWVDELKTSHPTTAIEYCCVGQALKQKLVEKVFSSPDQYVLFVPDGLLLSQDIDVASSVATMKATHAYGFYFDTPTMPLKHKNYCDIDGCIKAWQFAYTPQGWVKPGTLRMALYAKNSIASLVALLNYDSFGALDEQLTLLCDRDHIGLFNVHT